MLDVEICLNCKEELNTKTYLCDNCWKEVIENRKQDTLKKENLK